MRRPRAYLALGRVSNLPTVWTNTLAGMALGGGAIDARRYALLAIAFSLSYTGGMFLNDAFDREIDARERPERPIPAGHVTAAEVFALGFGQLGAGVALVMAASSSSALLPALALAATIVLYDAWHKKNPVSPIVMGLCRALVYITAAHATAAAAGAGVWLGAGALLGWVLGLTYAAKQERFGEVRTLWPLALLALPLVFAARSGRLDRSVVLCSLALVVCLGFAISLLVRRAKGNVPRAVVTLIAGISLVDALLIASTGHGELALVAMLGFGATIALQRLVRGT